MSRSTKTAPPACARRSRDAAESDPIYGEVGMATKDKNTKKSAAKKPAQKTLKEKRQAKRAKK